MALQNCSIEPMNTFLSKIYYIPNYQREYSWEVAELEDFWDDLNATRISGENSEHFFGQIVVHNDETNRKKYIIDGQQRTITSMIFMRTLQYFYDLIYRDTGRQRADYRKSDISSIHIGRYLSDSNDELHLHLGELDNEYFREKIQLGSPEDTVRVRKKSHERLRKAYVYFYERIKEKMDQPIDVEDKLDVLDEYYDTFTKRFSVLYMEATKLEEAFVIFETLNARGKDLETADLLKNFVFSQTQDIISAQNLWNSMINTLDQADPTKYIRHYWNATQAFTREKSLYKSISKIISSPRASKEFLRNLASCAQCYHDISAPDDNVGFSDIQLINSLKALKMLKASTFYPVVLAIKQAPSEFNEQEIREVIQTIEVYVFRNFTICGKVANKAEVIFATIAKEIYDGVLSTKELIIARIKHEMVGDQEFYDMFKIWSGSKTAKEPIRYILRKVHKFLDSSNEINIDNTEVHIEHIMPEDNSIWQVDDDVHETYLWRLGNLALLSGAFNREISNRMFESKKERYEESKIEPNPSLANCLAWTAVEIETRQQEFASYALQIWKK
ncbi:MAG: DUF262 domain-containing protein [Clostridia bacterium]|nr:DUF262 domain-containing protein [Clostridia bacterium]